MGMADDEGAFRKMSEGAKTALGSFSKAATSIKSVATEYKNLINETDRFGVSQLKQAAGIQSQINFNDKLLGVYKKLGDSTLFLEARNKELNKTFGVNSKVAAGMSQTFANLASDLSTSAKNMNIYGRNIKQLVPAIKGSIGTNKDYYKGLVAVQRVLTTNLGLTEEQANKYSLFAAQSGDNTGEFIAQSNEYVAAIKESTGLQFSFKDVTEEITKASAATQLQFGRMPGNLELAAIKAKSLGFTLDEMTKIGTQMLDIESSIGAELEYQLLSGNRLVDEVDKKSLTNKFREAALAGDASKQADALNTILNQEGEVLENNLLARQQMSKLLNMDEASLARALQKKKILEASGASELFSLSGDELETAATQLVKDGKMKAGEFKKLMENTDTRTTAQKMDEQMDLLRDSNIQDILLMNQVKMQTDVSKLMLQALDKDANINDQLLKLSESEAQKVGSVAILKQAFDQTKTLIGSIKSGGILDAPIKTNDDFVMSPVGMPGYERVLSGPEGSFAINNNDVLMGMTNPTGGGSGGMDPAALANAIVTAMKTATFEVNVDPIATGMA